MPRLIDPKLPAAWERELRQYPPPLVVHGPALDTMLPHRRYEGLDVISHQIELVHVVLLGRMHGNLGRRQSKD